MSVADVETRSPDGTRARSALDRGASTEPAPFPTRAVVLVALVGLALRLVWCVVAQPGPVADYLGYRSMAERLLTEGTFIRDGVPTAWRVPGYPAVLALAMVVSRAGLWLSAFNALLSAAVVPLTACVAHRLRLPTRAVVVGAVAAAVMPPLVLWAPVLGSENLQVPLVLGAIALALDPRQRRGAHVGSGALFGAAVLVRPESLVYLAAAPVLVWASGTTARRALVRSAPLVLTAVVVVAPWYVRNEVVVGRGVGLSSTGGMNFYLAHRPDGYGFVDPRHTPLAGLTEDELSETGYRLGIEHLREEPFAIVGDVAEGTVELLSPPSYAAHYSTRETGRYPFPASVPPEVEGAARFVAVAGWIPLALVAAVGLVRLRTRPRALASLGALLLANWACFAVVFWAMPRYRLPVEPLLCIAVGAAVALRSGSPSRQTDHGNRAGQPTGGAR